MKLSFLETEFFGLLMDMKQHTNIHQNRFTFTQVIVFTSSSLIWYEIILAYISHHLQRVRKWDECMQFRYILVSYRQWNLFEKNTTNVNSNTR